jgi:hypothetical protein
MTRYEIRASYDERTVRVYQAYAPEIARTALAAGRLVPPFKRDRMTWIKPSFNWMMYRSGHATKPGQEMILGIDVTREGFEWALAHATLSTYRADVHGSEEAWQRQLAASDVRVQWDPERDWQLGVIEGVRAIQIGLSGEAARRYVDEWIVRIEDLTPLAHRLAAAISTQVRPEDSPDRWERPYPVHGAFGHILR